ncbi:hypothetical protein [Flavobacterium johnsoniae]|uniref:Uncharacterized protein n=1 Tax=Flavobacterium johnsoniae (strain ATCC 17061 / DSM 2064 / JCM 8514 / BCRC 14874 / CCUG 350202 / NBRC 14942 / NCIMB 11054 / UW101) TaxID=376686 RepID=A5FE46_FLAJ1|nr:hypothetical protein [Flavobacterium johnsoniae]ABQ06520.1 hypothetical protein Fjoh_3506 [Flavobacterium johnsoniae UW101]OXE99759.1 hypothetical protein B0A63_10665 [Flavobacterium johnsoniae UW101]WQG82272.1 hypothetical protein SR927_03965 [Flavobacterium johnsoniae UW101]SHK78188.1 hypothetical protein SAMN05444146_2256 [Flavobacterium johnsoniae]
MKNAFFVLLFVVLSSGNRENDHKVIRSFCYWKTNLYFQEEDDSLVNKLDVKHMYVRFFDVDYNPYSKEPLPVATIWDISFNKSNPEITPSIFITNEVVLKSDTKQLDSLAVRMAKRIEQIGKKMNDTKADIIASNIVYPKDYYKQKDYKPLNYDSVRAAESAKLKVAFKEILIDCDWTEKSQKNYFYLLKQIKSQLPSSKIAATIRLWQYKYASKAGIPPVDKGLLMCYNITKPDDLQTKNSIATSEELAQYITHGDYKLKLDIALPLYSWAVAFRGNQFKGILSDYDQLIKDTSKVKKTSDTQYVLQDDVLVGQTYLRNGDEIRIEKISDSELDKMISIIKNKIQIDNQTKVTFFSFDKKYINDYGTENISNYYARF